MRSGTVSDLCLIPLGKHIIRFGGFTSVGRQADFKMDRSGLKRIVGFWISLYR
jgi:hypothetical protein